MPSRQVIGSGETGDGSGGDSGPLWCIYSSAGRSFLAATVCYYYSKGMQSLRHVVGFLGKTETWILMGKFRGYFAQLHKLWKYSIHSSTYYAYMRTKQKIAQALNLTRWWAVCCFWFTLLESFLLLLKQGPFSSSFNSLDLRVVSNKWNFYAHTYAHTRTVCQIFEVSYHISLFKFRFWGVSHGNTLLVCYDWTVMNVG